MNAKDLRIGNYVNYQGRAQKIYGLNINLVNIGELAFDDNAQKLLAEKIKPIPLTEQWLIDLGGIETSKQSNIYFKAKRKTIIFDWSSRVVEPSQRVGFYCKKYPHIKYVHQLQNLFYSLCGKELILKQ